jgi:hypothetical protein
MVDHYNASAGQSENNVERRTSYDRAEEVTYSYYNPDPVEAGRQVCRCELTGNILLKYEQLGQWPYGR